MFERFTDRARTVVRRAVEEARAEGQRPVGTEHLLLAVLADGDALATRVLAEAGANADDLRARIARHTADGGAGLGAADAAALREIGIDLAAIVARIEESFGPDALREAAPAPRRRWRRRRYDDGRFSPRAKKVLELSLREAIRLRHHHIGTEHILLGLLREGHGLGALVLTEAGVGLDDLRRRVETALRTAA
ncbi:Clp amino terminal domain-containing protein, pathogenicity island component [Micromonospora rhizosphaerae]|uniref:Clp amino terminal domain-containing protein, pathogenicity island component n=1 Tax=Micromonospora rhizosphaerae TaxID=568872 RepID=A0A1C6RZS2_9ACTN|nr:Clp protease N-terminal domain-containing protein [Micromonospora rhizosphaerae]SCL22665.1 Clp amino terminal domain-containing protein, pathogenicity island component [Micromonospora rhizosphaerae]